MRKGIETVAAGGTAAAPRGGIELLRIGAAGLGPFLAGSALPFVLVLYLALKGGGYDAVVRSEIGIAVWWIVLLGALVGILPMARIGRAGWVGVGVLGALLAWTALGISWSESSERSVAEVARVATYLGVLVLALATQGRDGVRRTVGALATALSLVAALALLSRVHPSWFPGDEARAAFESARARLNYPVNYWNGLAALMAIGVPLVLVVAVESRRLVTQALATAALPVLALTAFYTLSRGGAVEIAVALATLLLLYPRRFAALPTLLLGTAGSAFVIVAATQRDALENGLATQAALDQGDEMLAFVLVVCAGVALLRVAAGLAARHGLAPRPTISRRASAASFGIALVVSATVAVAAGAPGEIGDAWDEFKRPIGPGEDASRFESASGNGRYQYWQAALDANATDTLVGIGPGSYEFFWAREGELPGFVRDAHSLYLEALGELGIVGLGLIVTLVVGTIALGAWRTARAAPAARPWLAGATAAGAAFATAAAIDWAWEIAVIPVAFLLLAAAILAASGGDRSERTPSRGGPATRAALALVALACLVAIAIPLAGANAVRASQEEVNADRLGAALDDARRAADIQPYAATPSLQEALVLERAGDLPAAATAARQATEEEPTNWRTWVVLSRIEAFRGDAGAAVRAYREARSLNPRSPLFAR
jgi:O-Antigen ligase